LPAEVNSWAYVVGAENRDTFNPVSYGQACTGVGVSRRGGGGCQIVTEGYLSNSGAHVTWGSQVPLGQPLSVRDPLWAWGRGRILLTSDGAAIANIIAGAFFDGMSLLLLYILVVIVRDTSSRRTERMSASPGAHPGGVRQPHPPVRGHHGSGARRPARRGRGR
jgi:hypothetical protein